MTDSNSTALVPDFETVTVKDADEDKCGSERVEIKVIVERDGARETELRCA
jgi:hypothetical protein